MSGAVKASAELPIHFRGEPLPVSPLGVDRRREIGLSTEDTIIEVIGDGYLVQEAVDYCRRKKLCGFDLETGGENPEDGLNPWTGQIVLCQLGDRDRQYLLWWQTLDRDSQQLVIDLLGDEKVAKAGLNLKFDLRWFLVKHGYHARAWNVIDSMLIEQVINCGLFSEDDDSVGQALALSSMEHQAKRWLGLALPKDEELRTGWAQMTPGQWWDYVRDENGEIIQENGKPKTRSLLAKKFYAADDVIIPLELIQRQKPWIKRLGLVSTVNLEHAFLPVLAEMEVRGIQVDLAKWDQLADEALTKLKEAKRALDKIFDVTVTIEIDEEGRAIRTRDKKYTSTVQLKELIRDHMWTEHQVDVVLTNRHLRESLLREGLTPEWIERVFQEGAVAAEKAYKASGKKKEKKKFGTANSNDLLPHLWEKVARYLPKNAFMMPDTESKTFKLLRILGKTPDHEIHSELPTRVGLPAEMVTPILDMRKYSKAHGTYGPNWHQLINRVSGRLHFNFIQGALTTGRLSSTPNCQNLPGGGTQLEGFTTKSPYRECFVAAPGYKMVGADWDQIEPRIIAQLSDCFQYKRVFFSKHPERPEYKVYCKGIEEALDLYTEIGKIVGVVPEWMTVLETKGDEDRGIDPLPEGKKGRKQAKIIVLGLGYGTGKKKFYLTLIVDTDEHHQKDYSDMLFDRFWESVPEVKKTLDAFSDLAYPGEEVRKHGRVIRKKSPRRIWHPYVGKEVTWSETLGGRKRFYRPDSISWWTTGRNHPIQGTGADVLKRAAVLFARWCWENEIDGGLVNLIHDEFLAEIREAQAERAGEKMKEIMREVGEAYCPDVPIPVAAYIADFWKH